MRREENNGLLYYCFHSLAAYGEIVHAVFTRLGGISRPPYHWLNVGKSVGDDFREGKATLPTLIAYQRGGDEAALFWKRVIEKRDQKDGDLEEAIRRLQETGALEETLERARAHAQRAREALSIFPNSPLKAALSDVVDFVVERAA